jgi:hypothetical protein
MTTVPSSQGPFSRFWSRRRPRSQLESLVGPRAIREGRYRDVQGSAIRAAALGAGDGLITNISLVLPTSGWFSECRVPVQTWMLSGWSAWQGCLLEPSP